MVSTIPAIDIYKKKILVDDSSTKNEATKNFGQITCYKNYTALVV